MRHFIFLILFFGLTACSSMSKNTISTSQFPIQGGATSNSEIQGMLTFQRYSWYQEWSLFADLLVAEIPAQSPYRKWFTQSEQLLIKNCDKLFYAALYTGESDALTQAQFEVSLREQHKERLELAGFKKELLAHPDFDLSPKLYKFFGICLKGPSSPLKVHVSGFQDLDIDL